MSIQTLTQKECDYLFDIRRCLFCGSNEVLEGPTAGLCQNLQCADLKCGAKYNLCFGYAEIIEGPKLHSDFWCMPPVSYKNWIEDFYHENGRYQMTCINCGDTFFGHKRRVSCKLCQKEPNKEKEWKSKLGTLKRIKNFVSMLLKTRR